MELRTGIPEPIVTPWLRRTTDTMKEVKYGFLNLNIVKRVKDQKREEARELTLDLKTREGPM